MTLSPLFQRLLAVTLLAACLWLFFAFVAQPLLSGFKDDRDAIDQTRRLETRYLAIASVRPQLEQQLRKLEANADRSELSFQDESDALTGARIQTIVTEIVAAAGGRLNSSQILQAVEESGFRRVAVRVQMVADIAATQAILYRLEDAKPYLFIENLTVRVAPQSRRRHIRRRSNRPEVISGDANPSPLNVRFDILGYAKAGGA